MEIPAMATSMFSNNVRPNVTYHPNIWGEFFLGYASQFKGNSGVGEEEHEWLKEEIRNLFLQIRDDSPLKLDLIDSIQRLGVGYHFEKEIRETLKYIHENNPIYENEDDELRVVALRFRLLRQQGYLVPCDVFQKFLDIKGRFKESIRNDVEGTLGLYEASNFGVDGEEILDKALEFGLSTLESLVLKLNNDNNNSLLMRVKEALKIPINKTLTRLGARTFISMYKEEASHNEKLLNFAKLDFNLVQNIHQKELGHLTRWWKELNFAHKLPFARDRLVECYFWIVGVYFEPHYATARKLLTKLIYMASVLDDIYDVYGTLDELSLFTSILQRWDIGAIDQLPLYMRIYFQALFDLYVEMEEEMGKIGKSYAIKYGKQEMIRLAEVYFQEAQWSFTKYKPSMHEYMKVALISSGYMMMSANSLCVIGDPIDKEEFDWFLSNPPILRASSIITRLMDDLAGYGSEKKLSAVHYYMNENGVTKEEAITELSKQVNKAWKDLNEECVEQKAASNAILKCVMNFTRVIVVLYTDKDGYGDSRYKTKEMIKSLLVDPITI
uniref:Terpene synthase 8 n=1 Tax=Prunella vulgaris TaxID=39358 RepID=A0A6B7LFE7_PRUVU|nr:terpene synthase 8 [Prunella vulgaris]